jgi:hypothetical protein
MIIIPPISSFGHKSKMIMPLPMKMKTIVSVLVVAALTLLMFMEVSATCRQRQMITDKSSNVHSSVEAAAAVTNRFPIRASSIDHH